MALSDTKIKALKPSKKAYRVSDGGGLYLQVTPAGSKLWRYRFRFDGRQKQLSLGMYPDVSLAAARKHHQEARTLLADGIDPAAQKQAEKGAGKTFKEVAGAWHKRQRSQWTPGHAETVWGRLEKNVHAWIGDVPINDLTAAQRLAVLRRIESRGALEVARRVCRI